MDDEHQRMIATYQPGARARVLLSETPMVLMVGMTGVGRDTIISALVERGGYYPLVTATTRLPRINNGVMEQSGIEYYFPTTEQAVEYLQTGGYIEVSWVHGRINGLLVEELQRAHDSGKIAITDVDPQGAFKYHQLSGNVRAIYVLPPSYDEWMVRNKQRYASEADFEAAWPKRRESAIMELGLAIRDPFYSFVINDTLPAAIDACDRIARGDATSDVVNKEGIALARAILDRLLSED